MAGVEHCGSHEGGYDLVATDSSGSVTSRVARLTVDSTFVVVREGAIVTDSEGTLGYGWADYDGDGDLDLLAANAATTQDRCSLYRNQGDGSFSRMTAVEVGEFGSIPGVGARDPVWRIGGRDYGALKGVA